MSGQSWEAAGTQDLPSAAPEPHLKTNGMNTKALTGAHPRTRFITPVLVRRVRREMERRDSGSPGTLHCSAMSAERRKSQRCHNFAWRRDFGVTELNGTSQELPLPPQSSSQSRPAGA